MSMCASDTQFAISSRAGHDYEVVSITIIACTNATVLGSVGGVNHGRRCIADRHHLYGLSAHKGALAAAGSARGGKLRRSQERHPRQGCRGPAYGAKEPARGGHRQRHGAIALNLLLEG